MKRYTAEQTGNLLKQFITKCRKLAVLTGNNHVTYKHRLALPWTNIYDAKDLLKVSVDDSVTKEYGPKGVLVVIYIQTDEDLLNGTDGTSAYMFNFIGDMLSDEFYIIHENNVTSYSMEDQFFAEYIAGTQYNKELIKFVEGGLMAIKRITALP